jgi:hypothetical protein
MKLAASGRIYITERPSGSEPVSDRGRSQLRRSPEDRFSVGREEAGAGVGHEGSEPAGHGGERRGPPPDAYRHFGDSRPWA